ncbi:MAG: hypothetical protein JWM76_3475 [Pseudonocardiales bacterium]|nr:hypothetical protein [Pseudonocardiales bacterium]
MTARQDVDDLDAAELPPRAVRAASFVSDSLGPLPTLAALCGSGTLHASVVAGISWGLLAMFFAAILPYLVTWKVRHPSGGGRPSRRGRGAYMGIAVVTAAVGIAVLILLGAPAAVVDATLTILICLGVVAVTNSLWRWSNHMAACAAGVVMLCVLFGWPGLIAAAALPAVAWARLRLGRHSRTELVLGALCGAAVAGPILAALV